jgi:hypothetical protein
MLRIYNILSIPTLVIHELLHVIVCLLVGSKWSGILVEKMDSYNTTSAISFTVFSVSKYRIQNTLIHLAPFMALLIPIIMLFHNPVFGLYILIYQTFTIKLLIPSDGDYMAIKKFKTTQELYVEQTK